MLDEITAIIGSQAFTNWTSYSVDLDFLTPTDAFTLTVANPTTAQVAAIVEGTPISLLVGLDLNLILRGWVDEKRYQGSRSGDIMTFVGRDASAPLVDCHAPLTWSWKNTSLAQLAQLACRELGIAFLVDASAEASTLIPWVHAEPGETYWDILEREAKRLRLMLWATPGFLHIGRPDYLSAPVGQLRRMVSLSDQNNIKSVELTWKVSGRRSPVTVTGQSPGSDALYGSAASRMSGIAVDSDLVAMGLTRPCVVHDGGVKTTKAAIDRAKWEVSRRQGEAWSARYTVPGHRPSTVGVWGINTLVDLADERAGLSGPRWISGVRFQKSRAGTETVLTLRDLNSILPPI